MVILISITMYYHFLPLRLVIKIKMRIFFVKKVVNTWALSYTVFYMYDKFSAESSL